MLDPVGWDLVHPPLLGQCPNLLIFLIYDGFPNPSVVLLLSKIYFQISYFLGIMTGTVKSDFFSSQKLEEKNAA